VNNNGKKEEKIIHYCKLNNKFHFITTH